MQLLVKRGQSEGTLGRVTFDLWAKFKVTDEDSRRFCKGRAEPIRKLTFKGIGTLKNERAASARNGFG